MAEPDNLKVSTSLVVDLPADRFDLADWIVHFSSEEYIDCTPATHNHKYSDVYRDPDGGYVFRNDEFCGGIMMTQLYRGEIMEREHVFLVSPRTKGRFLWVWPMTFQITWDMKVEPFDENRSKFTCTIGSKLNPVYQFLSFVIRLTFWAQAHADEETPHFADSAARWVTRNDAERRASYVSPSM